MNSGLAAPHMYEFCEKHGLPYTFGLTSNPRLVALADDLLEQAVAQFDETGQQQRLFRAFDYRADSWDRTRTVRRQSRRDSATAGGWLGWSRTEAAFQLC